MPALFTRMYGAPKVSRATRNASPTEAALATSHCTAATSTPWAWDTASAWASSRPWSRPIRVRLAPRAARASAVAAPMPRPPPVTIITVGAI